MTTRFCIIENQVCLSVDAIAATLGLAHESALNTIWKGLNRSKKTGSWLSYGDAADGRRRWIVYRTIPAGTRELIDRYYGDVQLAAKAETMSTEALRLVQPSDEPFFLQLSLPEPKCVELAEGCGWMRLVVSDWWKAHWRQRTVYYDYAARVIADRDLYGLRISSGGSLRRKVKRWNESGRESLVPGHIGNTNAAKVSQQEIERLIDLYGSALKPSYRQVAKVYNREAAKYDWAQLSEERIRQLLNEPENSQIWFISRHGVEASRNAHEATLKRKRASFPDALWVLDGTTVQLYYVENGKAIMSNLYIYAAMDAYSEAIVGYAIEEGRGETATIVQACLRDATRKTGMRPFQLQYDNSSANKSKEVTELMGKLARVGFPTAPYNGKAKSIERVFGHFEQTNLRLMSNFKGGNITARSLNTRSNPDHVKAMLKAGDLPTKEQAIAQVRLAIETHNHSEFRAGRKATRAERYRTAHEKREAMDYLSAVSLFWVERSKQVRYTKDGLRMQVNGELYYYSVEQSRGIECRTFRAEHLGDSFAVKYDPDDLEYINLYKDEVWVATARQKYEFAMAKVDAEEGEGTVLREALNARKEDIASRVRRMHKIREEQADAGRPVLDHALVNKEAYNRMQEEYVDELVTATGRAAINDKTFPPRRRYSLYDDQEADGSIIE